MNIGAKKAAVKLSGISAKDRQWILKQLNQEQRDQVTDALSQLQRIQGNNSIAFETILALEESANETTSSVQLKKSLNSIDQQIQQQLNQYSSEAITIALNKMSKVLVFNFLDSGLWPQAELYTESFNRQQKSEYQTFQSKKVNRVVNQVKPDVKIAIANMVIKRLFNEGEI